MKDYTVEQMYEKIIDMKADAVKKFKSGKSDEDVTDVMKNFKNSLNPVDLDVYNAVNDALLTAKPYADPKSILDMANDIHARSRSSSPTSTGRTSPGSGSSR